MKLFNWPLLLSHFVHVVELNGHVATKSLVSDAKVEESAYMVAQAAAQGKVQDRGPALTDASL